MKKIGLVSWRLPGDIYNALRLCKYHNAGLLQLDFGGNQRGPLLSSYDTERIKAEAEHRNVALNAIALNLYNDMGIMRSSFSCKQIFIEALALAEKLAVPTLFIPSFRLSSINNELDLLNTAGFLRWCCDVAGPDITVASENTLTPEKSKLLCLLVAKDNFKLIFDPANLYQKKVSAVEYFIEIMDSLYKGMHIKHPTGNDFSKLEQDYLLIIDQIASLPKGILSRFDFYSENDYRTVDDSHIESDLNWLSKTFRPLE
ncbi:hypothetical protein [Serratia sp. (in: enterobacteria)]|uniref:hypothetical protein n=1 Tax=Serratia sp. (in: enterobacteria) TaxID=616 RepID=UPI003988BB2A